MDQVLDYKHHEKEMTHKEYIDRQSLFEEIGYELYGLLKRKELLQQEQVDRIEGGAQISMLQQINQYIGRLDEQVKLLQIKLQEARENMDHTYDRLIHQTIDVKKYEKLKEKQLQRFQDHVKSEEMRSIDEIAVVRHATNEIR
jgi:flagellar FliJ protein